MAFSEPRTPTPETVAVWTRLITASRLLVERVEAALKGEGLPPLGWYDALWELERAAPGLRPFELQQRLLLPQYGTSRLLERLVQSGLVQRLDCEDDGRGQVARITDAGRDMRRRMWPVYAAELSALVELPLREGEAEQLAASLGRLIVAARGTT